MSFFLSLYQPFANVRSVGYSLFLSGPIAFKISFPLFQHVPQEFQLFLSMLILSVLSMLIISVPSMLIISVLSMLILSVLVVSISSKALTSLTFSFHFYYHNPSADREICCFKSRIHVWRWSNIHYHIFRLTWRSIQYCFLCL